MDIRVPRRLAAAALAGGAGLAVAACTSPNIDSSTVVVVDGKTQTAAEFVNAGCERYGDTITVSSGSLQTGNLLRLTLTDSNPPTVSDVFITVGASKVTMTNDGFGPKVGSATASKAGNRYTITGEGQSLGAGGKPFRVEFTCA